MMSQRLISREYTEPALAALSAKNITATFFVTGQQVVLFPQTLKKIHDAGHEIGYVSSLRERKEFNHSVFIHGVTSILRP